MPAKKSENIGLCYGFPFTMTIPFRMGGESAYVLSEATREPLNLFSRDSESTFDFMDIPKRE